MTRTSAAIAPARVDPTELAEVRAGLLGSPKSLPPKFFYDQRGSELFEAITRLPEYYPTRAERAILAAWMPELILRIAPRALVELGAGSAEKTRYILEPMRRLGHQVYLPLDVSTEFLHQTAARLRTRYPGLEVHPIVADLDRPFTLPRVTGPVLVAFLGSTIGNYTPPDAVRLLRRLRAQLARHDRLLIGLDLRKERRTLERAYDDAQGVTAEFNRNALRVLNARFGADFDPDAFDHRACYRDDLHRIEMHLVARGDQIVRIPAVGEIRFAAGESVLTEISCKYDRAAAAAMFDLAGLRLEEWRTDPDRRFALALAERRP